MGSGITKWNITFSSIYKIGTDKVSYYVREKNCVQEINHSCTQFFLIHNIKHFSVIKETTYNSYKNI